MLLVRIFKKNKKVVDKYLVSDEHDPQVFKTGANSQPSTSKVPSQEESGMLRTWFALFREFISRSLQSRM